MQTKIISKKDWECYWCKRTLKKRDNFMMKNRMYICKMCWYRNSQAIFEKRVKTEKQELIFWKPIK